MKKALGLFLGLIGLLIVCCVFVLFVPSIGSWENPFSLLANHAQVTAANAAIDVSGMKDKVASAIEDRKADIAAATGLDESTVDAVVDDLAIDQWEAAVLPEDAVAANTFDGSALGVDGTITTYDDPSYVTVDAYGQTVTLAVPESAQAYVGYLPYVGYLG